MGTLTTAAGFWADESGPAERLAVLAVGFIRSQLELAAEAAAQTNRTGISTKIRQEAARKHGSNEWLEAAHWANPALGAGKLARAARRLVDLNISDDEISAEKRAEITVYRARKYLTATRKQEGQNTRVTSEV
jgi:hypothetical protein